MSDVIQHGLTADQRLMIIRALAVQALRSPGFYYVSREAAGMLRGKKLFDEFKKFLEDVERPRQ